jgi:hypothetical protein
MPISPTGNRQASVLSARLSLHLNYGWTVPELNNMEDKDIIRTFIGARRNTTPEQVKLDAAKTSLVADNGYTPDILENYTNKEIMERFNHFREERLCSAAREARHDLAVSYGHRPVDIALFSHEEIVARHEEALQRDADAAARGPATPGTPGRPRVTSPVDAVAKKPRKLPLRNIKHILVVEHGVSEEALAAMNPWEISDYAQTFGISID